MTARFIVNHLWQSSCFVLLAAWLAFVLRKNPPKVRYWVWLSASLKFLAPFALLVSLGNSIQRPAQRLALVPTPIFSNTLVQIAQPFSPPSHSTLAAHTPMQWAPVSIVIVWALGFAAITWVRCRSWIRMRATVRAGTPIELAIPIPAVIAPGAEEPGIAGFLRPVLILPPRLREHLSPRQLNAVLAHELCHVRRWDNFFAAIHMAVEAIFWFHPLVWWIGSRMVEERELACDQEVLRMGCEPTDYVEAILKVCRFYTESQLPCVSGVTGADVKKRLRIILAGSLGCELTVGKKAVLAAIGVAALAAPIAVGVLNASQVHAQSAAQPRAQSQYRLAQATAAGPLVAQVAAPQAGHQPAPAAGSPAFESASVQAVDLSSRAIAPRLNDPQRFEFVGDVEWLMEWAFGVRDFQISGGPAWLGELPQLWRHRDELAPEWFEIHATAGRPSSEAEMKQMVQTLLDDRFNLKLHRETRQISIYALGVGPDGPRLVDAKELPPCDYGVCGFPNVGGGNLIARGATMAGFALLLTNNVDRPVIDKTGLTGHYDFTLTYPQIEPDWRTGSAIFAPLQTLGLKLEPQTEAFEVLMIDSAGHPSQN